MSDIRKCLQLFSLFVISLLLLTPTIAHTAPSDDYNPNELSYGLYWFGKNDANQKFVVDEANAYFDSARPTLIFVHGWQPYISDELPDFDFNGNDTASAWIDDGWNVGVFVWNQFSDETTGVTLGGSWFTDGPPQGVKDAEAKIWAPDGAQGMRWRDWNDYIDGYGVGPSDKCAADLFYEKYIAAMEDYTGTIRIAGHSLGNQMAVRLAKLVHDGIDSGAVAEDLRPTRVALLDPYWSPDPRTDLTDCAVADRKTGDVVREYIAELLPTGTLFEWYWSSGWTTPDEGDANDALKPMVLYAEMSPQYAANDLDRHMAPRYLYFWAKGFEDECTGVGDECRLLGQMSDAQLASLMRSDYRWAQSAGQTTDTPNDDFYTATQQVDVPYEVTQLQADTATQTVGGVITVTATVTSSASPAPDGTLVTFDTNLGSISARSTVSGGIALAHVKSNAAGIVHIFATTQGADGEIQSTITVTFTEPAGEPVAPEVVSLDGPTLGIVATPYTFTAAVEPISVTLPITYVWQATGQTPVTHTDVMSITDMFSFTWNVTSTQSITVTATNLLTSRSGTHTIAISDSLPACPKPLTGAAIDGPVGITAPLQVGKPYTFTAVITPAEATEPITYTWSPTPINGQNQVNGTYQWADLGTYTITLTAENCGDQVEADPRVLTIAGSYQVYLPLTLRNS